MLYYLDLGMCCIISRLQCTSNIRPDIILEWLFLPRSQRLGRPWNLTLFRVRRVNNLLVEEVTGGPNQVVYYLAAS